LWIFPHTHVCFGFRRKNEKKRGIEMLRFFKVFERVGGVRSAVLLTPDSSQGFYPPQYPS
jgi:hypothetical protein